MSSKQVPTSRPLSRFPSVHSPSYKPRKVKNRGALLTLLWNFVALVLLISFLVPSKVKAFDLRYQVAFGLSAIVYPLAGWLADVYLGRYRVLKFSMVVMWVAGVLYTVAVILRSELGLERESTDYYMFSTVVLGMLGLAAFQSNAVQFGVDQLVDASSTTISSYISWYAWSFFVAVSVVHFSQICTCPRYSPIAALLLPVVLTVGVCSDILFNSLLVKEPASLNPLKMIFKVLRYAVKNKHPRQRSAFTYWDDKRYSRIDLGKDKYGGPFTTEQVEDVKTFFRIIVLVMLGSLYAGLMFVTNSIASFNMMQHYSDPHYIANCSSINFSLYLKDCFERVLVDGSGNLLMVFGIPVFELILYPMFWKCAPNFGIMRKFTLGIFLQFLYHTSLLLLEIVGHQVTSKDPSLSQANYSVSCLLNLNDRDPSRNTLIPSFKWLSLSKIFNSASVYCLLTSTVEFVCAQSPYSMKGLMGGIIYCLCGLAILLFLAMKLPFQLLFDKKAALHDDIQFGCGVWYYLSASLLSLMSICVAVVATVCYRRRRRDENIHNEHIFAVNYYS